MVSEKTLDKYGEDHASNAKRIEQLKQEIKKNSDWTSTNCIINQFGRARVDVINCEKSNFLCLDVGGNNFRIIFEMLFGLKRVVLYVRAGLTHAEYSKIDICQSYGTTE